MAMHIQGKTNVAPATAAANRRFQVQAVEEFKMRGETFTEASVLKRADQLRRLHMARLALATMMAGMARMRFWTFQTCTGIGGVA